MTPSDLVARTKHEIELADCANYAVAHPSFLLEELITAIEQLQAERNELIASGEAERRDLLFYQDCFAKCRAEADSLRAELAAVKQDAERYRWLKAHHLQTGNDSWIRTGEDLEEAVDAARAPETAL